MNAAEAIKIANTTDRPARNHVGAEQALTAACIRYERRGRRSNSSQSSPDLFLSLWEMGQGRWVSQESGGGSVEYSDLSESQLANLRSFYDVKMTVREL